MGFNSGFKGLNGRPPLLCAPCFGSSIGLFNDAQMLANYSGRRTLLEFSNSAIAGLNPFWRGCVSTAPSVSTLSCVGRGIHRTILRFVHSVLLFLKGPAYNKIVNRGKPKPRYGILRSQITTVVDSRDQL